jgi:PAS domain S-box-containing protein
MGLLNDAPSTGAPSTGAPSTGAPSIGPNPLALRQSAVLAFGRRTSACPDLSVLMRDAVALVAEILKADLCGVGLVGADGTSLRLSVTPIDAQGKPGKPTVHPYSLSDDNAMATAALKAAYPIVTADLATETRDTETRGGDRFLQGLGVQAAITVPLHLNANPFGVLGIYSTRPREFTPDDTCFAETIAHLLTASIARVNAEEALRGECARSHAIWESVDTLVMTLDADGKMIDMNPACAETTRFSIQEVRDKTFWSMFAVPNEADLIRGIFRGLKSGLAPSEFEGSLLTKDGNRRYVSWSLKTLCNGQVQSIILAGTDNTERIQAEEELERVKSVVERTTRKLSDLHDEMRELENTSTAETILADEKTPESPHPFQVADSPPDKDFRNSHRRAYPYLQKIAPMINGRMPTSEDFIEVSCNDISGNGVSFFLDQRPDFKDLVVALGCPPMVTFFVARVTRVATIEQDESRKYLVGCRFTRRVSM